MGSSFINYQIYSNRSENVIQSVAKLIQSEAYVSSPKNHWVTVYDETSEDRMDYYEIHYVCQQLSSDLATSVLALIVHTDLYFLFFLYENGECLDEYHSEPDEFQFGFDSVNDKVRDRFRGKPQSLLKYCLPGLDISLLKEILQPEGEVSIFQRGRHAVRAFAALLDIDAVRASLGFRYFQEDNIYAEEPVLEDFQDFQLVRSTALP